MLKLSFTPLTPEDAAIVTAWHYPPPYDVYNEPEDSTYTSAEYMCDPAIRAYSLFDSEHGLVAYATFSADGQVPGGDYSEDALDMGMMVRPDLTGRGLGHQFVNAVIAFAIESFEPTKLRVTIAKFNIRAQKVWRKAGFVRQERFEADGNSRPFIIFTKPLNS